ncbi:hypothetical protein BB560_001750 [Smittium megazygosporum]|uniref:Dihydrofolate reductase n=1 Tax=Smittium megazygosporum TaxID=133381 RepID=A0A2T9ZGP9_9FUNG|nr:hypothetical protein BB560_001751 [Smittium megazygosporum]PVV03762.1 hypothetical protein BB560_001750 [Smittium megazygosporum]
MVQKRIFNLVAAIDQNHGIGKNNDIPWEIPEDMKYFNTLTKLGLKVPDYPQSNSITKPSMNVCIMGRKTWISIPERVRPLKDRFNIVISSKTDFIDFENPKNKYVKTVPSIQEALNLVDTINNSENGIHINSIFVVGGQRIYEEAINHAHVRIFITHIQNPNSHECTVFFPKFLHIENLKKMDFDHLASLLPFKIDPGVLISKTNYKYEFTLYQNF